MSRLTRSVFLTFALVLLIPASALAGSAPRLHAARDFARTFPHATVLCWRAEHHYLGAKLTADTAQVSQDCVALHAAFASAQSTYTVQVAGLQSQVAGARSAYYASVQTAAAQLHAALTTATDHAAVKQARFAYRSAVKQAGLTRNEALAPLRTAATTDRHAYVGSVESARQTFWSGVHALRGLATTPGDAPVTQP